MKDMLVFCGILYNEIKYRNNAISELVDAFGKIALYSKTLDFSKISDYYDYEMGGDIVREWVLFKKPVHNENFYEKKIVTNGIEEKFRQNGKRKVNIDPGQVNLHNIQLLTTKNFAHRVYIAEGIYAEVTFIFRKGGIHYLEWTYMDYKTQEAENFFLNAREHLKDVNKNRE